MARHRQTAARLRLHTPTSMRTPTGSASRACHRRVVALIAGVWTFETFIANSTKGSKLRNWHRPERCQFLATEVSRDFIPPCPVRISPAQAAALGPAIKVDAEPQPPTQ